MNKDVNKQKWLPEISSDFAILDVTKGRKELDQLMIGYLDLNKRKPRLIIEAEVDDVWGISDGTSQEFSLNIKSMRWKR